MKQMMNSNQYDELLIKYLADDLNTEEKDFVESWIHASEENGKHFEELKRVWHLAAVKQTLDQVLDGMNMEEKWNLFQQNVGTNEAKVISVNQREELAGEDEEEERPVRKSLVYRLFVAAAIAASVILVIGFGWKFLFQNDKETPVAINPEKPSDSIITVLRHEVNTTGKDKRLLLPDGSLIVLANKSEITYHEPFINSRDITLIGKASFKVAKDRTRPFTVTSDHISTTALGTEFTVTAFMHQKQITVRLFEGKVVIKPVEKDNWRMKKDFYLSPGQEFVYSNDAIAKVRAFKSNNDAQDQSTSEKLSRENPSLPKNIEGSWYMFNNESLEHVFDNLATFYNVKIVYSNRDVKDLYFIGKYNSSDSVETILKRIAILNNLTITKKDSAFIISK